MIKAQVHSYYPMRAPAIIYLDDDPATVAGYYMDRHVMEGASNCVQLLSAVWHHNFVAHGSKLVTTSSGPTVLPGWSRAVDVSAKLFGQPIFPQMSSWVNHPHIDWAMARGGNYDWVWQLGMHLVEEVSYRWDSMPADSLVLRQLRDMLMALQVMPRELEPTRDEFYEAPYCLDEVFQIGSSIESFRTFYTLGMRSMQGWSRRPRPEFATLIWEAHPHLHLP